MSWYERAWCAASDVDPETWFPNPSDSARYPTRLCRDLCPVREQCLAYALDNLDLTGVWGGTSHAQRVRMSRRRKRAAA